MSSESSISTSLLDRVKLRESEAWERLVALYSPVVYWCARESGVGAEDAADVVQEVFGAVARRVVDFRRDRLGDSFRSWLWTIMRNKIRDHFRRCRDRPQAQGGTGAQQLLHQIPRPPESKDATGSNADTRLSRRALEIVRSHFENRTWQAFWKAAVDGMAAADVAEDLGMTVHAVYKAKSRVLCRLRMEFGDLLD